MDCESILLADRNPGMLAGVSSLLATEPHTVLMAVDEVSLMAAIRKVIPDLVIADLSFPVTGGDNVVKVVRRCNPGIKIIVLSVYDDPLVVDEIMKDGADGFVLRPRAVVDLIPAIRKVCQGGRYVPMSSMGR